MECPRCNYPLSDSGPRMEACGRCGAVLPASGTGAGWIPIARVSNLAEAGYMVDYLLQADIEADIAQEDDFNAAAGAWLSHYLVRVAEADAERTRQLFIDGDYGDQDETGESWDHEVTGLSAGAPTSWLRWLFVLGVLGSILYLAMDNRRVRRDGNVSEDPASLQEVMRSQPGPWIYRDREGLRSELYFDKDKNVIMIQADRDGDGVADYYRTIPVR